MVLAASLSKQCSLKTRIGISLKGSLCQSETLVEKGCSLSKDSSNRNYEFCFFSWRLELFTLYNYSLKKSSLSLWMRLSWYEWNIFVAGLWQACDIGSSCNHLTKYIEPASPHALTAFKETFTLILDWSCSWSGGICLSDRSKMSQVNE